LLNTGPTLNRITQRYTQKTIYWSAYAYGAWAVSEEFNISGGARWNYDSRDFHITAERGPIDLSGVSRIEGVTDFAEEDWAGDLSLEYKPLEDVTVYGKYGRGWKGPHINGLVFDNELLETGEDPLEPVRPETVNVLETGFKTQWLDRRLQLNAAGFYYDYDDIQIFQLRNADSGIPVPTLINSNDAELYGIELEVTTRPLEGWAPLGVEGLALFGSFSWLNGKYKDFSVTRRVTELPGAPAVVEDFSGNQLINSPEFSFTGYAAWQFDLDGIGFLTPRFDWSFKDQVFFNVDNQEHLSQEALWLFNIRLAYQTPNELVEVAGFVRNLTDEIYRADVINLSRFRGAVLYAMGDPRVYGVSVNLRW
jgi:iron complex outermembrane receptor protein